MSSRSAVPLPLQGGPRGLPPPVPQRKEAKAPETAVRRAAASSSARKGALPDRAGARRAASASAVAIMPGTGSAGEMKERAAPGQRPPKRSRPASRSRKSFLKSRRPPTGWQILPRSERGTGSRSAPEARSLTELSARCSCQAARSALISQAACLSRSLAREFRSSKSNA